MKQHLQVFGFKFLALRTNPQKCLEHRGDAAGREWCNSNVWTYALYMHKPCVTETAIWKICNNGLTFTASHYNFKSWLAHAQHLWCWILMSISNALIRKTLIYSKYGRHMSRHCECTRCTPVAAENSISACMVCKCLPQNILCNTPCGHQEPWKNFVV